MDHKFKWIDGVLVLGMVMMVAGLVIAKKDKNENKVEIIKKPIVGVGESDILVASKVNIDIGGEVIKPGVYSLDNGSLVVDVLALAGGLTLEADRQWVEKNVNKAEKVRDGMKIYIPSRQLTQSGWQANKDSLGVENIKGSSVVSLNNANLEELDTLPGVGPSIAGRIMEYRTQNGGFRNIEEIKMVSGIGDKLYFKIKDKISL